MAPADYWTLDTGLGVAARYEMPLDDGASVSVVGKALWQHSFGDTAATQEVSLAGGGGSSVVSGADPARDGVRLVAGVEYRPSADVTLSLDYAATLGGEEMSHVSAAGEILALDFNAVHCARR
ncbi:autotransporter outer membrane beta-barrel domain-containing protein [Devosia sp. BK]|nr:autotransporter outer membrane beta-barrel domain-containing protein [Devosia sp. BK]